MTTDTSERGLERLICTALAGHPCDPHKVMFETPNNEEITELMDLDSEDFLQMPR